MRRVVLNALSGGEGCADNESCGVTGCSARVLFWCDTTQDYVCWDHGELVLRREWQLWGHAVVMSGEVAAHDRR